MASKEQIIVSEDPLKDALTNFNLKEKMIVKKAIDNADDILANKFLQVHQNVYFTGLKGHYVFTEKTSFGTGENVRTFSKK